MAIVKLQMQVRNVRAKPACNQRGNAVSPLVTATQRGVPELCDSLHARQTELIPFTDQTNRIGRRIIMCMLLIAALAVIWNLLGAIMKEAAN